MLDEYNNTYHRSLSKKPIHADYSALTEEIELKVNLKLLIESGLLRVRIFLAKVTPIIGQEKYFWSILC